MYRIITPEPSIGYSQFLGIEFVDGVATVEDLHPEREKALIQHGYAVTHELEVGGEPIGDDAPIFDLEKATVPQLRKYAAEHDISLPSKVNKPDLVRIIGEAPADPIPGSIANADGSLLAPGGIRDDSGATIAAAAQQQIGYEPDDQVEAYIPAGGNRSEAIIGELSDGAPDAQEG